MASSGHHWPLQAAANGTFREVAPRGILRRALLAMQGHKRRNWFMTLITLREYLRTTEDAISSGRIEEAMANCQSILTYFPEALEAQRLLGEVYLAQGQLQEAQQTFEWILTNDPENVIVYCDRALISERSSDIDTALDCYQQAYELSRGSTSIRQQFNQLSARV